MHTLYDHYREDLFVVIASDGLWDVLSSQQVVDYVYARLTALNGLTETGTKNITTGTTPSTTTSTGLHNPKPKPNTPMSPILLPQIADDLIHYCIEELPR